MKTQWNSLRLKNSAFLLYQNAYFIMLTSNICFRRFSVFTRNKVVLLLTLMSLFVYFVDSWMYNKARIVCYLEKKLVLFSLESRCFPRLRLGKHRDSWENKTTGAFFWGYSGFSYSGLRITECTEFQIHTLRSGDGIGGDLRTTIIAHALECAAA